jgi:hypothetical protein
VFTLVVCVRPRLPAIVTLRSRLASITTMSPRGVVLTIESRMLPGATGWSISSTSTSATP